MPFYSIIIPVYNAEKYLDQCIQSVLAQTFSDFELILIHDVTDDRSGEICDRYASGDERVTVVHQGKQGVSFARNKGIELSTGNWLTFIDADDWVEPDMLETSLARLTSDACDILIFDAWVEYKNKARRNHFFHEPFVTGDKGLIMDIRKHLLAGSIIKGSCVSIGGPWARMFKRELILEHKIRFPEGIAVAEDLWFNFICFKYMKTIEYVSSPMYHYRRNYDSACHRYRADLTEQYIESLGFGTQLLKNEPPGDLDLEQSFYVRSIISFPTILRNTMHKDSPWKFRRKRRQIAELCDNPFFYDASRRVGLKNLSPRDKAICILIRAKAVFPLALCYFLYRAYLFLTNK